jgi:hypothetical protein
MLDKELKEDYTVRCQSGIPMIRSRSIRKPTNPAGIDPWRACDIKSRISMAQVVAKTDSQERSLSKNVSIVELRGV